MEQYKPCHESIEAVEVTDDYIRNLPKMGGNPCRLGEQVEIYSKNNQAKSYAQKGDFIVKYEDHDVCYFVVPGRVFEALFAPAKPEPVALEEKQLKSEPETVNEKPVGVLSEPEVPADVVVPEDFDESPKDQAKQRKK